jgi:hypothetical protein
MINWNCCFFFLHLILAEQVAFGESAFLNETDFQKIIENRINTQSFERIREKQKSSASLLIRDAASPIPNTTPVSSGYIVLTEYQGINSSSESCNGVPVYYTGVVLGLCIAVKSGYHAIPFRCSAGSYVKFTAAYSSETIYITYTYFSSSACSTSCGSYIYQYDYGCTDVGFKDGAYQSYSISLSINMVIPTVAGILQQEYVSSSCSGTLTGYTFEPNICNNYFTYSYKTTCSSDNHSQIYDIYDNNTDCSGVATNSYTYDSLYACASYSSVDTNNILQSGYEYSSYYSNDDMEATFYKQSCKAATSSTSSCDILLLFKTEVIVVITVFSIFVVLLIFYCRNASIKNNNTKNNNMTVAFEIVNTKV